MKPEEDQTIPKAKRPYRRRKEKRQFTVRIDENLAKAVKARAESEGLRLTDAMEDGLWLWARSKGIKVPSLKGRFIWNVLPPWLQKATIGLIDFCGEVVPPNKFIVKKRADKREELLRRFIEDYLGEYAKTPEHQENLRRLAAGEFEESHETGRQEP